MPPSGPRGAKARRSFPSPGKINNTGLVEVPMGTTLREVIYNIGGGIPRGRRFKAAQMGGPSGGCLPSKYLDLPIDYESLTQAGSMMGSGGMIVMDEKTCMVDIARFFLAFTQDESCGKCVPCRIGTKRMLEILTRITKGEGKEEDIDTPVRRWERPSKIRPSAAWARPVPIPCSRRSTISGTNMKPTFATSTVLPAPARPWSLPPVKIPARSAAMRSDIRP